MTSAEQLNTLRQQLGRVIVGQAALLERLVIALLSGGHVLLEGPPGLAKTTAVHALANAVDAGYQRIQFTPDLMPGDLTGSEIYEPARGGFRFIKGPVFHEILLADEINRAPPKVQSALLEAMAEHQVTVAGTTYPLPDLFLVLATQNPLEQTGTYPLPEAQLDRFLFKLLIDYPSAEEELLIARQALRASEGHVEAGIEKVLSPAALFALRAELDQVFIEERLEKYVVAIVTASRDLGSVRPDLSDALRAGASPRAVLALMRASMARAFLNARDYVLPEDIVALAPDVLRHRLLLDYRALSDGLSADDIVRAIIEALPPP